jgi:hypothetical protein
MSSQSSHPGSPQALAAAFGHAFWVAVARIAATLVPALLLPRPGRGQQAIAASRSAH